MNNHSLTQCIVQCWEGASDGVDNLLMIISLIFVERSQQVHQLRLATNKTVQLCLVSVLYGCSHN